MSSPEKARVLLADDHEILLEGLRVLLENHFEVAGAVGNGVALLEAAQRLKPDIIVTDVSMPQLGGLEASCRLREAGIDARVIILTMHTDGETAAAAFRAGASGYVLKQSASKELVTAIHEVLSGHVYLTPLIARDLISLLVEGKRSSLKDQPASEIRLSPRQKQVLKLVAEGRTMKEVGNALNISPRTAEAHKYEMMESLGAKTTADLIQFAFRFGLVTGG